MKYVSRFILVLVFTTLAACESQNPSEIQALHTEDDSLSKPSAIKEREAWVTSTFDMVTAAHVDSAGSNASFNVSAQSNQYADSRLTLMLEGSVNQLAGEQVVQTYWRQVTGPTATILDPSELVTEVTLPNVSAKQTVRFELVGVNSSGFYDFASVVVSVLPLAGGLSIDLSLTETDGTALVLSLDSPATETLTYRYITLDGSAVAGQDFQFSEGQVTFPAGSQVQEIPFTVLSESLGASKVFYLQLNLAGHSGSEVTYAVVIDGSLLGGGSKSVFCDATDLTTEGSVITDLSIAVVDALGQALVETPVLIATSGSNGEQFPSEEELYHTNDLGSFVVPCVLAGTYSLFLELPDESSKTVSLEVGPNSQFSQALVSFPVRLEAGLLVDIDDVGLIVSLSGMVRNNNGEPIANAQIEVSAGVETNGAIAVATTDADGSYSILLNVGEDVAPHLQNSQIRVVAAGYRTFVLADQDLRGIQAQTGLNFVLQDRLDVNEVYYSENFDGVSAAGYCGAWQSLDSSAEDIGGAASLWHLHEAGLGIQNRAYVEELVVLAPDDTGEGYVPDPQSGSACWYGDHRDGTFTQGNFLGESDSVNEADTLNGGKSASANDGVLVSPWIDLSNAQSPLSLSFLTWWEIESVNPNDDGYDLMSIQVKTEADSSWNMLARLNPLSDPIGNDSPALPYSNRGFNRAPAWLSQEPISLDNYVGQRIQIRFVFETEDSLYNGFRGWMVDDIVITNEPGSFPVWGESQENHSVDGELVD